MNTYKILADAEDNWIRDGEKVKLNVDQIKKGKDWHKLNNKYKSFVLNNANTIFTVKFEEKYGDKPSLVTFAEDNIWLWWVEDLIRLTDDK